MDSLLSRHGRREGFFMRQKFPNRNRRASSAYGRIRRPRRPRRRQSSTSSGSGQGPLVETRALPLTTF